jgi:hypothetical protein
LNYGRAVADTCGVFVSSSLGSNPDAGGIAGSKEQPFKTLGAALLAAAGQPIYACGESFSEVVTISTTATIYGALDCTHGWVYNGANKTQLTAASGAIPLTVSKTAAGSTINDFAVAAADATPPSASSQDGGVQDGGLSPDGGSQGSGSTQGGGSSIGVVVDNAAVTFTRVDIMAGKGADAAPVAGITTPTAWQDPTNSAVAGLQGSNVCVAWTSNEVTNGFCGGATGGSGGPGAVGQGYAGEFTPATTTTALGGAGEPAVTGSWGCTAAGGGLGANGTSGAPGVPGAGASSIALGTVSTTGYVGIGGGTGGNGLPGQGGGGGGGARGTTGCTGASGGSGGAGGCGGLGGNSGNPGGSSIGIIALGNTVLTFNAVTVTTKTAGNGGDGGAGQNGGVGGNPGTGGYNIGQPSLHSACEGGSGGHGGKGGQGGGGRGGHSIGIAYTGSTAPGTSVGVTITTPATGGLGGNGDNSQADAGITGSGAPGVAANTLAFN